MKAAEAVDEIERFFAEKGGSRYGEEVTMSEHALLTAQAARRAGAPDALVAACLLHDIGHFLGAADDEFGHHAHDSTAAEYLAARFPGAVVEPIRLHVAAKRYLCGVDAAYWDKLSPASQHSLRHQGGPMSAEEGRSFEEEPFAKDAIALRRLEDAYGKVASAETPEFTEFRPLLEGLVRGW